MEVYIIDLNVNISLMRNEAWALNTFYGNSNEGGVNNKKVGGMKRFLAAAAIAPSILRGRSDVLTHTQEYAKKGYVFNKGDNSIITSLEIESKLEVERKKSLFLFIAGSLMAAKPAYFIISEIVKNPVSIREPANALNISLLTVTGVLLGHFWWKYFGMELGKVYKLSFD